MVVFDMAGTTVDEDNVVYKTLQEAIVKHSISVTLDEVLKHGAGKEKLQAIVDILEQTNHPSSSELVRQIYNYFIEKLTINYKTLEIKALPNVERVFKELMNRNIRVVLNTGYNRETAESLIEKLGWELSVDYDLLVTASDVKQNRPNPDMILSAMADLNITDPSEVIKVGDSAIDIMEGRNANCRLNIGITTGAQTREQLSEADPDFIIDDIHSIVELIDRVNNE
ncbi:MAG: HAD family hydrolase [Sphingobacteriales bacterium 17-39-43]|nr:MAG: HAD family hydrolase [Sphingobacteriales bacterium 16-39-50]OZA25968.1 MAG: HAD family hydrolase [Sphingobacteriales bacterium 17-39-43]